MACAVDRPQVRRLAGQLEEVAFEGAERLGGALGPQRLGARREVRSPPLERAWERAILLSIALVLVLLVHAIARGDTWWTIALDTAVCAFLLVDFLGKAAFVRFHPVWLRRHVLTDFVPALPFAWLTTLEVSRDAPTPLVKLLRSLRALRGILPLIRLFRGFSFLMRGLDRLVARHARELDTKVLVFPSPAERRRRLAPADESAPPTRYWRLRGEADTLFAALLESADEGGARRLAEERLRALEAGASVTPTRARDGTRSAARAAARMDSTPLADDLLVHLGSVRSEELEGRVGTEAIGRIARAARLVARTPLRFVPFLGASVPAEAVDLPDRRVASRSTRRIARRLARIHDTVLWWADLKGSLTPGELVGRVGAALVARTSRPAIRLLLVATALVALRLALILLGIDADRPADAGEASLIVQLFNALTRFFSNVLVILGSLCLVLLGIGAWLQRLARDTTVFLERVARAQFLHLTDSIKARFRDEDAALVGERVFRLERGLEPGDGGEGNAAMADATRFARELGAFAANGVSPPAREGREFDPVARAVMLYRDLLDGALLARSDARVTGQLLGNLAVRRMLTQSGRVGPRQVKALRKLDLERRNTLVSGPYLWFHAITRALSSRAARLIVEYNAHAIPLTELERIGAQERARYERWIERRSASGEGDDVELDSAAPELTTAFTVMHFLDDAPARDAEVAARFGDPVLARMRSDRRALVRTVFGTYPLHELPREARLVSPKELYDEWVAGGRILVVPFRAVLIALRLSRRGLRALVDAVRSIRDPHRAEAIALDVEADFTAAARKIDRMRGPAALTALRLRATLDPQYVGLDLPLGLAADRPEPEERRRSAARRDAEFLGAPPEFLDELAALEQRAARTVGHIERLARGGLVGRIEGALGFDVSGDRQARRALVVLILGDVGGIRSSLLGREVLREAVADGLEYGFPDVSLVPAVALWWRFRRSWRSGLGDEMVRHCRRIGLVGDEGGSERRVRAATWRALRADVDGSRAALDAALAPEKSARVGEARLAEALRHPARVTEQLVTLRVVQTLTLIDMRNYRRHVWSLGAYAEDGDTAGGLLRLEV